MSKQIKKPIEIFNDFFTMVKLGPFCEKYTTINPKKRLYHNLKGYSTGGNPIDDIHPDDAAELFIGVEKYQKDLNAIKS